MKELKLPLCAFAAAALLCACAAPGQRATEEPRAPAGPGAAVVFEKQTFKLSKTPDSDLEAALGDMLTAGYQAAVKKHLGDRPADIGFTYSMAPKGATYPFSEMEVSCIMQEKYARSYGPRLCGEFFRELDAQVKRALGETGK